MCSQADGTLLDIPPSRLRCSMSATAKVWVTRGRNTTQTVNVFYSRPVFDAGRWRAIVAPFFEDCIYVPALWSDLGKDECREMELIPADVLARLREAKANPMRELRGLENQSDDITCPFCREQEFDAVRLKQHLVSGWCYPFDFIQRSDWERRDDEPDPPGGNEALHQADAELMRRNSVASVGWLGTTASGATIIQNNKRVIEAMKRAQACICREQDFDEYGICRACSNLRPGADEIKKRISPSPEARDGGTK